MEDDFNLQKKMKMLNLNHSSEYQCFRKWEAVGKLNNFRDDNSFKFKIISYNVLAQYYVETQSHLYKYCLAQDLEWEARSARLYKEILYLDPDILCLQEVQASHVNSFFAKLERNGYFGVFKQKTGYQEDGCAIYFKQSMFHMEDHMSVEFYRPEQPYLDRHNIGLILRLLPQYQCAPASPLIIATTHLLYNPKREDVRYAQLQVFLSEIDRFAYDHNSKQQSCHPVILTGDFNSSPDRRTIKLLDGHNSAGQFQVNSRLNNMAVNESNQYHSYDPKDAREGSHSSLLRDSHNKKYLSVYGHLKDDGSPEVTTFQGYWLTVDYIFYSCFDSLKLLQRLRLPTVIECERLGPLPNCVCSSDHFALGALFKFSSTTQKVVGSEENSQSSSYLNRL
ncbi:protein angel-like [Battus philenor]|uniref:protein angel-like n=1 Tax=Battus philenor TaxID=42288 RepID=UPI0035D09ECE